MNVDMGLCDMPGCGKPAVTIYSLNLNMNGPSMASSVMGPMRQRCAEHDEGIQRHIHNPADVAEIKRLRAFVRAVVNGWPEPTAPEHVRDIYIEALRTTGQELLGDETRQEATR
jgi:hypothetical protein